MSESLEVLGDLEVGLGGLLDGLEGSVFSDLGEHHLASLLVELEHSHIGDQHVHYFSSGQRQFAVV